MKKRLVCVLASAFCVLNLVSQAKAQETVVMPQQRLITVTGDAEVKIVPDEVVFSLGLTTSHKDLATAKMLNNERVKSILAVARQLNIAPKDVQTGYVNIASESYSRPMGNFTVRRSMTIILRKPARYDEALTRLVQNNRANSVQGIEFRTSQLKKHREQARIMAIKAAREKAVAMSGALGATIGNPYAIREDAYNYGYGNYNRQTVFNAASDASSGSDYGPSSTLAFGQIPVTARVTVSFELQ